MIEEMVKIKPKVKKLLQDRPELRDDDYKLIAAIIIQEFGVDNAKSVSAFQFLGQMSNGKFSNFESIRRVRAKIQEQEPELRGELYGKKKKSAKVIGKKIHKL